VSKREKLIASVIGPELTEISTEMLDATIKLILGDMRQHYLRFWEAEGPGIMVFQPENKERSVFFLTLPEIESAKKQCENEKNNDLLETFRKILDAAQKINPLENAGFLINDKQGIRYFQMDYQKIAES